MVQKALKARKKQRKKILVLKQGGFQALAFTISSDYLIMLQILWVLCMEGCLGGIE